MERFRVCAVPTIMPAFPDSHTYNDAQGQIVTTAVLVPILSSIKLSKGKALTSLLLILLHGGVRYPRDGLTIEGAITGE
jgi:hypothetical protein